MYKAIKDSASVIRLSDGATIPADNGNADYQYFIAWMNAGNHPEDFDAVPLATIKARAVQSIDADVDAIYAAAIGNRGPEYVEAERQATAYRDAGYTGDVPPMVACWATAKAWTATQAADDILAAALNLTGAQQAIRAQRLLRKEQVRAGVLESDVSNTLAAWAGFVIAIRTSLGV